MISRNIWQLLLSGLCCLALVVFTACDAQGPVKKSDNSNTASESDSGDKSSDTASDDAEVDDSSAADADGDDSETVDSTDSFDTDAAGDDTATTDDHDHDHDGHDHSHDSHDHDGHDHDHDAHDHDHDDDDSGDSSEIMSASPEDFTMNLDGMPTDRLVDPAKVLDTEALGMPIRASGVKSSTPKQAYEDLIYGNIRIRMDTSIALRRAMLENGVAPTDPGVRNLEGQILKARDLLEQAGESVGPIEPPIE